MVNKVACGWVHQGLCSCTTTKLRACLQSHCCVLTGLWRWCLLQNTEGVKYYRKPFEFLSLGIMAYVGNDRALTQVGCSYGQGDFIFH